MIINISTNLQGINMLQHIRNRFRDTIEIGHLVKHAVHLAFCAGTVISNNIEDDRIVHFT